MSINVPFLISRDNDVKVTDEMELAAAFLYFEANRSESLKSLFAKSSRDKLTSISRGIYPLRAEVLLKEDKLCFLLDDTGFTEGSVEVGCKPVVEVEIDAEEINGMDIKSKIDVLKGVTDKLKKGEKYHIESGNLIWGYENLKDVLEGKDEDALYEISVNLPSLEEKQESVGCAILEIINNIQESVEKEIGILENLCILDDDNFKNSISERNRIYEDFKDKIYQTDREVSANIASLIIEREGKIRDTERMYNDKCAYLAQDFIFNKNKHDISKIYGNETEMDIYRRSMLDAEEKIEKFKKEAGEEIKKLEKHYDGLLEDEKKKIKQAISDRDKKVKECEDLYTQAHSAIDGLKSMISSDIFARRNELKRIKTWMFKLGETEGECESINIPFYLAQYGEGESKFKIFFPAALEEKNKVMSLISGIAGKIPLPFGERHKFFNDLSKKLTEELKKENNNHIINMLSNRNLIVIEGIGEKVEKGLKLLLEAGCLNDKNYEKSSASIKSMLSVE